MGATKRLMEELYQALKPEENLKELEEQYLYELNQSRYDETRETKDYERTREADK